MQEEYLELFKLINNKKIHCMEKMIRKLEFALDILDY
jgi:hypothetical protein